MSTKTSLPVLSLGGGPAGMTAAIQLWRWGIPFMMVEKERILHVQI